MYDYGYYDYGYGYESSAATGFAALGIGMLIMWLISMAIGVFTIVCMWKVFKKACKPGWAAIVPVYNIIVMLEIAELPMWYIALFFVPFANIYAMFKIYIELAHKFGKSTGFGIGMIFLSPVFLGILAFDKNSNYIGTQSNVQPQQPVQQTQTVIQPQQPINNVQPVPPVQPTVEPIQPLQPNSTVQPTVNQKPAFCTNCGSPVAPNTAFCTNCGKQL